MALDLATSEEMGIDTLQRCLYDERLKSRGLYLGDAMLGAWARKPVA